MARASGTIYLFCFYYYNLIVCNKRTETDRTNKIKQRI